MHKDTSLLCILRTYLGFEPSYLCYEIFDKNKTSTRKCLFFYPRDLSNRLKDVGLSLCCRIWLGKRDGNITFDDSLDFDISEIESVYEDEGK